jgi:hypothetical protein
MDAGALRQFANRDWSAVTASRLDYWAQQYRQRGPAAAREASTLLWRHARQVQPQFPSDADRARDLADHLALHQRLDVAARALAGR